MHRTTSELLLCRFIETPRMSRVLEFADHQLLCGYTNGFLFRLQQFLCLDCSGRVSINFQNLETEKLCREISSADRK